ncbi:MAG: hypothetical protein AAGB31_12525, partial [Bdellovibrio sp.]
MHHSLLKKASSCLLTMMMALPVHAATPTETVQQQLTRSAKDGLSLQGRLTKNLYRQEPYEANYTVKVPYEATETYYVDVPYEEQEA